jgi:hypothetical protein
MLTLSSSRQDPWLIPLVQAICLIILLFWGVSDTWARPTTPDEAKTVVQGWLSLGATPLMTSMGQQVKEVKTYSSEEGFDLYFVVYLNPAGFVIVPADDLVEPIIAFLPEGTYDPSPTNPLGALVSQDVQARVLTARLLESLSLAAEFLPQESQDAENNQKKWTRLQTPLEFLTPETFGLTSISDVRISPLVQTKWSQSTVSGSACYNYYTPPYAAGNSSNYVCGCVATAMSQLMRFWQYPTAGVGTTSFTIYVDGVAQTEHLRGGNGSGGAYNWSSMPLVPGSSTATAQRQAIGALTHDAGVAVNMKYTSGESSAQHIGATTLRTTFGYSNAKLGMSSYDIPATVRNNMVNPNLDAGYPVLFGIFASRGGHAIVCDGYGYNLSTPYHHLNMGWSGLDDAWYNLPNITTTNYNFVRIAQCAYNVYVTGSGELISGRVLSSNGTPVSGVTVTAVKTGGGTYTATSNNNGIYALAKVPSGSSYNLSASKSGYTFDSHTVSTLTSTDNSTTCGNLWGIDFTGSTGPPPGVSLNTALDNDNLAFTTAGNANWAGETATYYYGGSAAQSGAITHSQSSSLQTTIPGPGTISFYWKVSSEESYDYLEVYLDGVKKYSISGEVGWQLITLTASAGSHTLKWQYTKDNSVSQGSDCGWVDRMVFTPSAPTVSLNTALDNSALTFTTGGDGNWAGESTTFYYGGSAAQSGAITDDQSSWLQTTVSGPATLSFYWKVSSESGYDYLNVSLDGGEQDAISGTQDWQLKTVTIPAGNHTIRWNYSKDYSLSRGSDCGWVDKVVCTPTIVDIPLKDALDNSNLAFATGGDANWSGESSVSHFGGSSAASGLISHNESSWFQTSVSGPGTLSFYWKVSSESNYDYLRVYLDGSEKDMISGEVDWQLKTITIPSGSHTVKWVYSKDVSINVGLDRAWVDQVVFTPSGPTIDLNTALDNPNLTFTTGGNANWAGQSTTFHYGGSAAKSGAIANDQSSWLQTTVTGPGTLSFYWNVSSEDGYDYLEIYIDGVRQDRICGEVTTWPLKTIALPASSHTIKWQYTKDYSVSAGSDCGWVDCIGWTGQVQNRGGALPGVLHLLMGE